MPPKRAKLKPSERLRDTKGRFVSRVYQQAAEEIREKSNVKKDSLQDWYNSMPIIEDVLQSAPFRTSVPVQSSQLFDELHNIRGDIFLNGKKVSEGILRERVIRFQQNIFGDMDCTGISYRPEVDFKGNYYVTLPGQNEIDEFSEMQAEEIIEAMSESGIDIWLSDPGKAKAKERHEKLAEANDSELQKIKDAKRKAKNAKSRTKRGKH